MADIYNNARGKKIPKKNSGCRSGKKEEKTA
jgi:hypothetical protein